MYELISTFLNFNIIKENKLNKYLIKYNLQIKIDLGVDMNLVIFFFKDVNLEEDRESAEDQNIDNQYEDLQQKYKKLQMEKIMMEESYKSEISDLQAQVGFIYNQHVILYCF